MHFLNGLRVFIMFYLLNDFQFTLNYCKQINKKEQYFYIVLGVEMKHENEGKNRLFTFINVWPFLFIADPLRL